MSSITSKAPSNKQSKVSAKSATSTASVEDAQEKQEWVRQVLRKYLYKYVRDYLADRKDNVPSPVTSSIDLNDGNGNNDEAKKNLMPSQSSKSNRQPNLAANPKNSSSTGNNADLEGRKAAEKNLMSLKIVDFESVEETALGDDRISYLSRILSLGVTYSVSGHPDHFVQWIVKVPSRNFDERNLARVTNVHRREVSFYADILPDIKMWLEHNSISSPDNQKLTLNVPTCYYAKSSDSDVDFDPAVYSFPNTEFTLILEDLRAQGFGKRHFSIGLTTQECAEVIQEIAKFHVTTWAMEQHSEEEKLQWKEMLRWEDLYVMYLDMIRQGYRHLHQFRQKLTDKSQKKLVDSLLELETKLPRILEDLLRPSPDDNRMVNSMLHMDLWTENLLFRESDHHDEEEDEGDDDSQLLKGDIDCMILDWQMVSYGKPTHDIGILLMTSLDGDTRRKTGMSLLKFYFESFEKMASSFKLEVPFDLSDLLEQYKESCLLATLLSVARLDLVVSEQSTLDRFFDALEDLKEEGFI